MTHVLVAEQDDNMRTMLREVLTEAGYTVSEATTQQATLDLLMAAPQPLVVVDAVFLPQLPSAYLEYFVQHAPSWLERHAFICLVTSPTELEDVTRDWLAHHHTPVIVKPFDTNSLLDAVAHEAARLPAQQ